jgi:hypothetical protein
LFRVNRGSCARPSPPTPFSPQEFLISNPTHRAEVEYIREELRTGNSRRGTAIRRKNSPQKGMVMNKRKKATKWIRFGMKCGLLATDPSVWMAVRDFLNERTEDVQSAFRKTDRLGKEVRIHRHGFSFGTLLSGIGIGVGIGMLLAPVSGRRARGAIRDTAVDVKNKVGGAASWATHLGSTSGSSRGYAH